MPIIPVTDAGDARIADYRNVPDPELLRRRGLFVAENRLVVRALLASARLRTRSVLVTDAAFDSLQDVLAPLQDVLPIYVCPRALMEPISGYDIHRGCLALGERPAPLSVGQLLGTLPHARRLVVLEAMTNADNVGAIFRNARAFGVQGIVVGPRCCDPLYRKAIRVSIGATLEVPYATSEGPKVRTSEGRTAAVAAGAAPAPPGTGGPASAGLHAGLHPDLLALKHAGFTLVALTPAPDAVDLNDFAASPRSDRLALLVGNEGEGLSAETQRAADLRVRIRMAPGVDSINASTATGIALHRLWGCGPQPGSGRNGTA
jgi:tRNA G18 (ribose-2'-O)-methylase SpoU